MPKTNQKDPRQGEIHSFSKSLAPRLGVTPAVVFKYMSYRIRRSKNEREGKIWYFDSIAAIQQHFPYLSKTRLHEILTQLVNKAYLERGEFNTKAYDFTCWYTLPENPPSKGLETDLLHFDAQHAKDYGILEAILIRNLAYWIRTNRKKRPDYNYHALSATALSKHLPFHEETIRRAIKRLVKAGVLIAPHGRPESRSNLVTLGSTFSYLLDLSALDRETHLKGEVVLRETTPEGPLQQTPTVTPVAPPLAPPQPSSALSQTGEPSRKPIPTHTPAPAMPPPAKPNTNPTEANESPTEPNGEATNPNRNPTKPDGKPAKPNDYTILLEPLKEPLINPLEEPVKRSSYIETPVPPPSACVVVGSTEKNDGLKEQVEPASQDLSVIIDPPPNMPVENLPNTLVIITDPNRLDYRGLFNVMLAQKLKYRFVNATDIKDWITFPLIVFRARLETTLNTLSNWSPQAEKLAKEKALEVLCATDPNLLADMESWPQERVLQAVFPKVKEVKTSRAVDSHLESDILYIDYLASLYICIAFNRQEHTNIPVHSIREQLRCILDRLAAEKQAQERQRVRDQVEADYYARKERFASPDQKNEGIADLSPGEKVKVLKNALLERNNVGEVDYTRLTVSHNLFQYNEQSWKVAYQFFQHNPECSVAKILEVLEACKIANSVKVEGYDPKFALRHGTQLTYFFKHLDQIVHKLEGIEFLPYLGYLEPE